MRHIDADRFDDFCYRATLCLTIVTCICLLCSVVFAVEPNPNPETTTLETVAETEPTETVAATEPEETEEPTIPPTEPEIPTEPATEPPAKLYDIPMNADLQNYIARVCEDYGFDPTIIFAMAKRESNYRPNAMGDNGLAYGMLQIHPRWHQARMDKLGVTDLLDPYQNVLVAVDYMAELSNYAGRARSIEWVLMAYNGGPDYASEKLSQGIITDYAVFVLNFSANLKGE